jgi:antitoxin ParD1/3/4
VSNLDINCYDAISAKAAPKEIIMGMNVNLTPQLEAIVQQKISSGLYASASEVVREALRLMAEKDGLHLAKLNQLRADIRAGIESGAAEHFNAEAVKSQGRAKRTAKA